MNIQTNYTSQIKQFGFTLIEAMIAFAVASVGILAVVSFQTELISTSGQSKAKAEALQIAQERLEEFKNYSFEDATDFNTSTAYADATYAETTDETITGTNATFTRDYSITSSGDLKAIAVKVSWTDVKDGVLDVTLNTSLTFESQTVLAAESIAQPPTVTSATGSATIGAGTVDCSGGGCDDNGDGTAIADDNGDLKLIIKDDDDTSDVEKVVLTLEDACVTGTCTQFVQIRGSVYIDKSTHTTLIADDAYVLASDAAYCHRFFLSDGSGAIGVDLPVVTNTVDNVTKYYEDVDLDGVYSSAGDGDTALIATPDLTDAGGATTAPTTSAADPYEYFRYTCYLGGGWHGNIGILLSGGNSDADKFCLGDPNAAFSDDEPIIAARRIYRGMTYQDVDAAPLDDSSVTKETYDLVGGGTDIKYYSQGIKDGAELNGQDFVIGENSSPNTSDAYWCISTDDTATAPFAGSGLDSGYMTRTDSDEGNLFAGVPADWYCLNEGDLIDPELPYGYESTCPYDPSSPPNTIYTLSGTYAVYPSTFTSDLGKWDLDGSDSTSLLHTDDLSASPVVWDSVDYEVNTSQSEGNCTIGNYTTNIIVTPDPDYEYYYGSYSCDVYDWPDDNVTGWIGNIISSSSLANLHCQTPVAVSITADDTVTSFNCMEGDKFTISGDIAGNSGDNVSAITVTPTSTSYNFDSSCTIANDFASYECTVVVWTNTGLSTPTTTHTTWSGITQFTSTKTVCHDRNYANVDPVTTSDAALFDDASATATYTDITIGDHINEDIELTNNLAQCAGI